MLQILLSGRAAGASKGKTHQKNCELAKKTWQTVLLLPKISAEVIKHGLTEQRGLLWLQRRLSGIIFGAYMLPMCICAHIGVTSVSRPDNPQ